MRFILTFTQILLLNIPLMAQNQSEEVAPTLSFMENEIDFGEAMEGDVLVHTFKFINTGNDALIISNILTSCGCTIVKWSREPIYPGKKGEIVARFDTKDKFGKQSKSIIVLSNDPQNKDEIKIIARVIPRSEAKVTH